MYNNSMTQADAPTPDKPRKTRRRWFQYSVRTLLVVVALFAGFFAWWSNSAHRQRGLAVNLVIWRMNVMIGWKVLVKILVSVSIVQAGRCGAADLQEHPVK